MRKPRAAGPAQVTAPMPGKIVRVLAAPGEDVASGAGPARDGSHEDGERAARPARRAACARCWSREGQAVETGALLRGPGVARAPHDPHVTRRGCCFVLASCWPRARCVAARSRRRPRAAWRARLSGRSSTATSRRATYAIALFPLEAEVRDLRVAGDTPGAEPFLEVPRVVAAPALRPALGAAARARARCASKARASASTRSRRAATTSRRWAAEAAAAAELRIRRLVIEGGEFIARPPTRAAGARPARRSRAAWPRAAPARCSADASRSGPGTLRFGTGPDAAASQTEMRPPARRPAAHRRSGRTCARREPTSPTTGSSSCGPRPQRRVLRSRGPVDLEHARPPRHAHRLRHQGRRALRRARPRSTAPASRLADALAGARRRVRRRSPSRAIRGQLAWDESGVHAARAGRRGARRRGPLRPRGAARALATSRLAATLRGADAEAAGCAAIFDIGPPSWSVRGHRRDRAHLAAGRIPRACPARSGLDLEPRADGRTPLSGRFEWRAEDGVQLIENADLHTPATTPGCRAASSWTTAPTCASTARARDLAETDELLARLRRALGVAGSRAGRLRGRGRVPRHAGAARCASPVFEGRFAGRDVGYLGVVWGGARWSGVADPGRACARRRSCCARPAASSARGVRWRRAYCGEKDGARRARAAPRLARRGPHEAPGLGPRARGAAHRRVRRYRPAQRARGTARCRAPRAATTACRSSDLDVAARLREAVTEVTSGAPAVGGGTADVRGHAHRRRDLRRPAGRAGGGRGRAVAARLGRSSACGGPRVGRR